MLLISELRFLRTTFPAPLSTSNVHDALVKSGIDYNILHVILICSIHVKVVSIHEGARKRTVPIRP